MCATVLFPHGRADLSSSPFCVLRCCSHMVVLTFSSGPLCVLPCCSHMVVLTFSSGPLCVRLCCSHMVVLTFASGPFCVLRCCSHMVVLIFQVARFVCYGAVPTWSCSPFQVARYVCYRAVPTWSCSPLQVARFVCYCAPTPHCLQVSRAHGHAFRRGQDSFRLQAGDGASQTKFSRKAQTHERSHVARDSFQHQTAPAAADVAGRCFGTRQRTSGGGGRDRDPTRSPRQ